MKRLLPLLFLLTFPAHAEEERLKPEEILGVVTGEWNHDGEFDRAVLVERNNRADLLIYLSYDENKRKAAVKAEDIAWSGLLMGTKPQLLQQDDGFLVISQNSIGRNHWIVTLTVTYDKETFIVSNYRSERFDTLDPTNNGKCELNLLTGKGKLKRKSFQVDSVRMPVAEWKEETVPKGCPY